MKRRAGFTITELLVSMALIMLIMAVMAEAFTESLKMFSSMKAIGDMDQKMRAAIVILTRDLSDDHFGNLNTSYKPLSKVTPPILQGNALDVSEGFFVISQSGSSYVPPPPTTLFGVGNEGNDSDVNPCFRNTTGLLHFTVNRAKNWDNNIVHHYGRRENYLMAPVPPALSGKSRFPDGQNYYSQVAEVAYFLRPQVGDTTAPTSANPGGLQRFTLYRRQALILTYLDAAAMIAGGNKGSVGTAGGGPSYIDVSWRNVAGISGIFNTFGDVVTRPNRRFGAGGYSGATPIPIYSEENTDYSGNDILLTDVLSFDIQVMRSDVTPYTFQDVSFFDTGVAWNDATTPWTVPAGGNSTPITGPFKIKAIQITIRVWDLKTQSARQITIVQDM